MASTLTTPINVRHRTNAQLEYKTSITTRSLSSLEKLKSGLKRLGIGLFVSLLFALVPVLHFVLVPLGLIVSLVLFFKALNTSSYRSATNIECPQCKKPFELKSGAFTWPMKENCPECRAEIRIEPVLN